MLLDAAHWFHLSPSAWEDLEMADVTQIVEGVRQLRRELDRQRTPS